MSSILECLNEEQRQALQCKDGAVLVTAGAGSGKTRLLTHRIAYLILEQNVSPMNILAITFTNKATREMQERISQMLGYQGGVWISTIHSMCATILRSNIQKLDAHYTSNFSIYSTDECQKEIKRIVLNKNISKTAVTSFIKTVAFHIDNYKNENIDLQEYYNLNKYTNNIDTIIECIQEYNTALKQSNAVDFNDLLILTEELLRTNEDVRLHYATRFQYIHVDEFQDTNVVQYNIVKLLSSVNHNVFVVGDEDQCIYGWRGASIVNISNFIKDYDNCHIFKLERNYRSTKKILDVANKLIQHNNNRIPKNLYTENNDGSPVIHKEMYSEKEEAEFVAQKICQLRDLGYKYKDIAVLMRLNALSRNFEQKFMNYNIPYKVYGGFKFFDRLEIKNVLAYLRLVNNPNDNASFNRVVNFPRRGIGQTSLDKLTEFANSRNVSLLTASGIIQECSTLNAGTRNKFLEFYNLLYGISEFAKVNSVSRVVDYVINNLGILNAFEDESEDKMNRELNLQSFVRSAEEFEKNSQEPTLNKYIESVSLISEFDDDDTDNAVVLASVHAVKGLEYKAVFIIGLEQTIFPIIREGTDEEEERRLLYVAITRAEELLFMTNAKVRYLYNKADYMLPSNFLVELGYKSAMTYEAMNKSVYGDEYSMGSKLPPTNKSLTELNQETYKFKKPVSNTKNIPIGAKVNHSKFGEGVVVDLYGKKPNEMVVVDFDTVGKKELMLEYAPLTIIN